MRHAHANPVPDHPERQSVGILFQDPPDCVELVSRTAHINLAIAELSRHIWRDYGTIVARFKKKWRDMRNSWASQSNVQRRVTTLQSDGTGRARSTNRFGRLQRIRVYCTVATTWLSARIPPDQMKRARSAPSCTCRRMAARSTRSALFGGSASNLPEIAVSGTVRARGVESYSW